MTAPTFHTLISKWADEPGKPVLVVGDQTADYRQMASDIARAGSWMNAMGFKPGQRALLYVPHPYAHWILTFALEQTGLTSSAVSHLDELPGSQRFLEADVVLTVTAPTQPLYAPWFLINQAWFDGLPLGHITPPPEIERKPSDLLRIIVTSGTTGAPKKIPLTRAVLEARIRNCQAMGFYSRPDLKMAAGFAFSAVSGWINGLYCFNEGGTLVSGKPWLEHLAAGNLNLLRMAPVHLQGLLESLPDDFRPIKDLRLSVIGGSLSPQLAKRAAKRLTPDILVSYGATETGTVVKGLVKDFDRTDAAGFICPWATVEAVSPEGIPVPVGELGEIRVKSNSLCDGYLDDLEATDRMFRDGWFWTGDLGEISAEGRIVILGRTNDLMNIGGAKVLATKIEAIATAFPGVSDAAAFPGPDRDGLAIPYLAYVPELGFDPEALRAHLAEALGREPVLIPVEAIPRNATGKIQRDQLPGLS